MHTASIKRNRPSVKVEAGRFDIAGLPTQYFNPGELETLLTLIDMVSARTVVEIGVNAGRNPAAVLRNLAYVQRYVGVDVTAGHRTTLPVQRREVPAVPGHLAAHDPRFELILRARGSFDLTEADLPKADAVFIDGDHSFDAVVHDWSLALEILNPGGIIIFHDDNCRAEVEVTQAINHINDEYDRSIKHVSGTWLAYEVSA
jgi:predicted O-methyltransferase YrrM